MVTGMRMNEPYAKISDTSKPWMETFNGAMMGWNHLADIEDDVTWKAGRKFAEAVMDGKVGSTETYDSFREFKYDRPDLIGGQVTTSRPGSTARYTSYKRLTSDDHDKIVQEAKIRRFAEGVNRTVWDRPMDITTADGLKVNSVIYANGGGVQRERGTATTKRRNELAREVEDTIARTGRVPMRTVSSNYRNVPNNLADFVAFYDDVMYDWVRTGHV